jgi:hypothetical protein
MRALSSNLRKQLETAVLAARRSAEGASRATVDGLGVFQRDKPGHLDADQAALRNGLRAKWRQLGEDRELLVAECAYEQWHRLLFARFLAENNLLLHPQYKAPVTLVDCDELAAELGEPDGWSVAARFAAEILPGIFPVSDPCFRLRFAPEGRYALEQILDGLSSDIFVADDALGWVYQFWQKERKDEVNDSERKIGGADLGPVTQLFTENYMVRFLLENSLGAWWAARHPDSSLVKDFDYIRVDEDGRPASGSFDGWPDKVSEVTVMDPCCGSGHFLVEAFSMLWQMRSAQEGLSPVEAQDAVLRENLFGLELDPRCVQIAMFAIAVQAWKAGNGWRELPVPNIACTGVPVKASADDWKALAIGDERVENALARLHVMFHEADTLGSLIDPRRVAEVTARAQRQGSLDDIDWDAVVPLLERAVVGETGDPATAVLGADAAGLARAAEYLTRRYTLIATNYPYLSRGSQVEGLREHLARFLSRAQADLATGMFERWISSSAAQACMLPQNWLTNARYRDFRKFLLEEQTVLGIVRLGAGAFHAISGEIVQPVLLIASNSVASDMHAFFAVDVAQEPGPAGKAAACRQRLLLMLDQIVQKSNPDHRIVLAKIDVSELLAMRANAWQGIASSDYARFGRMFWELADVGGGWRLQQSTVSTTKLYGGREHILFWEDGQGAMTEVCQAGAPFRGKEAWGRVGVVIAQMGDLPVTLYGGECFDNNTAVITLNDDKHLPALWAFCSSDEFTVRVREIDQSLKVTNSALTKVAFDVERWTAVADQLYPDGLPQPGSDDPTQWLFAGRPELSTAPLHVGVARLMGYRWPGQIDSDDLDELADLDGIVCLPSVAGEAPAADRLHRLLATAFGDSWSSAEIKHLLDAAGSKKNNLADWLRDDFFKQHCALFGNRPFVWLVWDGMRDGFSALVNCHRLDRRVLEKLTYTYLGQDWVERQRAAARDEVAGAEARLSAALGLQQKLEAILDGEKPYDVYVRWKALHEQPIGWEPDVNDGIRLNIRPFVEAGVLRSPVNVHWRKDRGKDPDGSERHNDIHLSVAEKQAGRMQAAMA